MQEGRPAAGAARDCCQRKRVSLAFVEEGLVFASDVTCEIVAQSRHEEFDGIGAPFVEESDLLRLFVNASARSQGDEGSIRRESGADRARQIVDDVVGTGIDLAEFVAGAVIDADPVIDPSVAAHVCASKGVLFGRKVAAHRIGQDEGAQQTVVGCGVPANVVRASPFVGGAGRDDRLLVESQIGVGAERPDEYAVALGLQDRPALAAQVALQSQRGVRDRIAVEHRCGRTFVGRSIQRRERGVVELRTAEYAERVARGCGLRFAPQRQRQQTEQQEAQRFHGQLTYFNNNTIELRSSIQASASDGVLWSALRTYCTVPSV